MKYSTNKPFTIIVPTDFSKYARDGLKMAIKLSEKLPARIHLAHWVEPPQDVLRSSVEIDPDSSMQQDIYTLKLIRKQKRKLSAIRQKYAEYPITTSIKMGSMSSGISELVDELKADFIVMGTSGERAVDEFLSGNHTEKVTKNAACPVMTVRKYRKTVSFNDIVLAIDLSEQTEAINQLVELTDQLGARLHLLFVDTSSIGQKKEGLIQLKLLAKRHRLKNFTLNYISGQDQADAIREMARIKRADVIAMITESTGFFMELFTNRPADELIKNAQRPVVTINTESASS